MFDSEGNFWVGDNFTVGWQGQDSLVAGPRDEIRARWKAALSPITTGFTGGGMEGGSFGVPSMQRQCLVSTYGSHAIAVFDKNGKPLSPPEGITFNGRLGLMQGVIVTPSGDIWVLGIEKDQLVYFPKGDSTKGGLSAKAIAPNHANRSRRHFIWPSISRTESGFPIAASSCHPLSRLRPQKSREFQNRFNNSGLAIDSQGNVWVTNRFGNRSAGHAHLVDMGVRLKAEELRPLRTT